jgi:hypothetical protein
MPDITEDEELSLDIEFDHALMTRVIANGQQDGDERPEGSGGDIQPYFSFSEMDKRAHEVKRTAGVLRVTKP